MGSLRVGWGRGVGVWGDESSVAREDGEVGDGDKRYRVGLSVRTFASFSRLRKILISILG